MATILIVDDQPANRKYLIMVLEPAGHRLLQANDAPEALATARVDHPDLIISDIVMPNMDGYELVRRIRGDPGIKSTPVIFWSAAFQEPEARSLATACGVHQVICKPCPQADILRAIDESLNVIPHPAPAVTDESFDRDHLRLLSDKLAAKVSELEHTNLLLQQEVAQRKRAEEELHDSAALLRILSRRLMDAQESERRSIAHELHDEIGQALSALRLNLHVLQKARSVEERESCILESVDIVEQLLQQVRDLSLNLRPSVLDDLGLVAALQWQLNRLAERAGFRADFRSEGLSGRLSAELETICFRVAQEALTNVVRHARARQVSVVLRRGERDLVLTVADDGVGFDVKAAAAAARGGSSLGLLGMQERVLFGAGELSLNSTPGRGTEIRACFPLENGRLVPKNDAGGAVP